MALSIEHIAIVMGLTLVAVVVGFLMGWRAARPDIPLIERKFDPGPTDEPAEDIWRDALTPPEKVEKGIPTT